jgi:ABC-type cobalamin/Fe3+-siderophores transport system ATPase subunit
MKLAELRIINFQCFGPTSQAVSFDPSTTMVIGPNGSGKTAILQALSRMFDANPGRRRVRREDFHVPLNEKSVPTERKLTIEADFLLPEAAAGSPKSDAIPPCFNHMRLDDSGTLKIRFRLEATMGAEGDIEESLYYVLGKEQNGEDKLKRVPRAERNHIAVYYLPAKREPLDQIHSGTAALLGRIVRAVDWAEEGKQFDAAAAELKKLVTANSAIGNINSSITKAWSALHKGSHFKDATVVFGLNDLQQLIENLSVEFNPAHASQSIDYSLLSDGQKSLLYLSLVVAFIETGRLAMSPKKGEGDKIQLDLLNPPVFSLITIEEPENSLSPHYLGRINGLLKTVAAAEDAQAIVTTHSPAMLRRIEPKQIRHTRIGSDRTTSVKVIQLPPASEDDAHKFVREGLLSNPEIYFARIVVLGEGASEDIVLPKVFEAAGLPMDENGIVLAQLGGRHVNYLWKLLSDLTIPYVTLLDLDLGRHQGGWGRLRYAAQQLTKIGVSAGEPDKFPKWDAANPLDGTQNSNDWLGFFKAQGVFFSCPLDLDFSMIQAFPKAYSLDEATMSAPDDTTYKSVLGKAHASVSWYSDNEIKLFADYHTLFKVGSKPASHIEALSKLKLTDIASLLPQSYRELVDSVKVKLAGVYE